MAINITRLKSLSKNDKNSNIKTKLLGYFHSNTKVEFPTNFHMRITVSKNLGIETHTGHINLNRDRNTVRYLFLIDIW